jgi:hypothetical protein
LKFFGNSKYRTSEKSVSKQVVIIVLNNSQEFRLSVYIFGLLSAIPAAIFLLVITLVIFSTSVLVSFIWTFFVFSTITIGLIILVPILAGFSIIAAFFIVGYYIYKYLLQLKQASNNSSDSNIKKSVKTN